MSKDVAAKLAASAQSHVATGEKAGRPWTKAVKSEALTPPRQADRPFFASSCQEWQFGAVAQVRIKCQSH
jgi:hypothetical protein